jgi:hypothetical protein
MESAVTVVKTLSSSVRPAAYGLLLLLAWSWSSPCQASVPHLINLQGRLTDASGNPIQTSTQVEFRLFQGGDANTADAGTLVYREIATVTPGPDGAYTYLLGGGSAIQGYQFTPSLFDTTQNIYLQLEINNQALLPRLQIVSAGTAMLTEMPAGFIGMFAQNCPTGWTRFTNLDGLFPRGADPGVLGGGTGGSATHTHTAGQGSFIGYGPYCSSFAMQGYGGGCGGVGADTSHGHTISPASSLPPYLDVVYCQKT